MRGKNRQRQIERRRKICTKHQEKKKNKPVMLITKNVTSTITSSWKYNK